MLTKNLGNNISLALAGLAAMVSLGPGFVGSVAVLDRWSGYTDSRELALQLACSEVFDGRIIVVENTLGIHRDWLPPNCLERDIVFEDPSTEIRENAVLVVSEEISLATDGNIVGIFGSQVGVSRSASGVFQAPLINPRLVVIAFDSEETS